MTNIPRCFQDLRATKDKIKNCSVNDQNNFDAGDMVEPILLTDYIFQLKFSNIGVS